MKTFSVLASLARAADPWVSKATCPYKSALRHCGCVTQPPMPTGPVTRPAWAPLFIGYQSFLRPSVMCQPTVSLLVHVW